jgi:hypothetical protein
MGQRFYDCSTNAVQQGIDMEEKQDLTILIVDDNSVSVRLLETVIFSACSTRSIMGYRR